MILPEITLTVFIYPVCEHQTC